MTQLPGLGEWARVVNWRRIQLDKLENVEVITAGSRPKTSASTARDRGRSRGSALVGRRRQRGHPRSHPRRGRLQAYVLTPEQVMLEGKRPPGSHVLVFDGEGYFVAAGIAELLVGEGFDVELVTLHERVARVADESLEGPFSDSISTTWASDSSGSFVAEIHEGGEATTSTASRSSSRPTASSSPRSVCPTRSFTSSWSRTRTHGGRRRSRPCTGSATASPHAYRRRRSSTGTGSHARSTGRTRRLRCLPSASGSCSNGPDRTRDGQDGLSPPSQEIEHTWLHLSDGIPPAARIWLPEDAEADPVPAVLEYPHRKTDGTVFRDARRQPYLAGHGYAAVRVDMRGTGDSDGVLADEYTQQEQDDALEILAWIAEQPWCTGKLGMWGISGAASTRSRPPRAGRRGSVRS